MLPETPQMNHDYLPIPDPTSDAASGNLILLSTQGGARIEMTKQNHRQLERELAGLLDDPLQALMEEVVLEYLQMGKTPSGRDVLPA